MRDLHALCTDENGNQSVPCHQSSRLSAVRPFGRKALSSRSTIIAQGSLLLFVLTSVVACYQRVGFIKANRSRLRSWALRHPDSKVGLMLRTPRNLEIAFRLISLLLCVGIASAQCPDNDATLPLHPISYPMASDQYAVQYQIDGGRWTNALVYISYYGKTYGSPYRDDSGYTRGTTSMSWVSIPARANALVQIRVTNLAHGPFLSSDHVTVRPTPKAVEAQLRKDGSVQLSTFTSDKFAGEQYILMWNRGTDGGGVEGLAFYLDPPYTEPAADSSVKVVNSWTDLYHVDLSSYKTLDFESLMAPTGLPIPIQLGGDGKFAYTVPDNIVNVYLGQHTWVQGKLRFTTNPVRRRLHGPGVLDGSQFNYLYRKCLITTVGDPNYGDPTDDGLYSLSSLGSAGKLTNFDVDGIIISDQNHGADDPFFSSTINNVKTLGWNPNNDAIRFLDSTTATNVFLRSGDDSIMIWGSPVTVTNATVWQGFNGGVVSLGWSNNSVGDYNQIDGLWVVKTDWQKPTVQTWKALSQPGPPDPLNAQNNGVFVSLMVPSTQYGTKSPPVFRNIFVEDPPQVLFSLRINPSVNCPPAQGFCDATFLKQQKSSLNLKIENLYSPQSIINNSIGFEIIPHGYIANATDTVSYFPTDFTLRGSMKIDLTNVWIKSRDGFVLPLINPFEAEWFGKVLTNGDVDVKYGLGLPPLFGGLPGR
jgi:hypothetical protein